MSRAIWVIAMVPGDLAVWDSYVAMVVGNEMMIEAGDDQHGRFRRAIQAIGGWDLSP